MTYELWLGLANLEDVCTFGFPYPGGQGAGGVWKAKSAKNDRNLLKLPSLVNIKDICSYRPALIKQTECIIITSHQTMIFLYYCVKVLEQYLLWPNQIWAVKAMDRRTYNRGIFRLLCLILECDLSCIIWILFDRTIRTFKLMPWRQFVQRITRDAVSAGEPHWWIGICRLLP